VVLEGGMAEREGGGVMGTAVMRGAPAAVWGGCVVSRVSAVL